MKCKNKWQEINLYCLTGVAMAHVMVSLKHGHTNYHTCTKPYKQAEKGQLLTGPRLIRTQFHNFLLYFWEQKKQNKKSVRITERNK